MHRLHSLSKELREITTMNSIILITAAVLACMCGMGSVQGVRPRIIVIRRPPTSSSLSSISAAAQTPTSAHSAFSAPPTPRNKAASPAAKVTSGSYDGSQGSDIYHNLLLAEHLDVPYSRDPTRHYLSNKLDIPYVLLANRGSTGGFDHTNYLISQQLDVPYLPSLSNGKRGADPLRTAIIMDSLDSPIIYRL